MNRKVLGGVRGLLPLATAAILLLGMATLLPSGALANEDHDHEEPGAALGPPTIEFTLWAYVTGFEDADGNVNPTLTVAHDDVVQVTIINGEDVEHNFVIDELEVHSEHVLATGEEVEVVFLAETLGEFAYYCNLPLHRATMEGTLAVQEPGAGFGGISTPLLIGIVAGVIVAIVVIAVVVIRNGRKPA